MSNLNLFLKDQEVADRYQISRATVWRWVKKGHFPKPIKIGGGVKFASRWRLVDLQVFEQLKSSQ